MPAHDYRIGASVVCNDGRCGRLVRLVVNPQTQEITGIVVEKGFLLTRDTVVPADAVESADKDEVCLSISGEQLQALPAFSEVDYETLLTEFPRTDEERAEAAKRLAPEGSARPTPGGAFYATPVAARVGYHVSVGVEQGRIVIGRGTTVMRAGEEVGTVDHVLVNPATDTISHLVIDQDIPGGPIVVPVEMVREVSNDAVLLRAEGEALSALPRYQPREPDEIETDLKARLAASGLDIRGVGVHVEQGVVYLTGTAATQSDIQEIIEAARAIPGVIDVENQLGMGEPSRV
ncbi:MAG: BON domain-containing protein [Anaerolineae bacterium]